MFLDTRNRLEVVLERLDHHWGTYDHIYVTHVTFCARKLTFPINVIYKLYHYYTLLGGFSMRKQRLETFKMG